MWTVKKKIKETFQNLKKQWELSGINYTDGYFLD